MKIDNFPPLTPTAEKVLSERYYKKDNQGNIIEDWPALCKRVVNYVCKKESEEFQQRMFEHLLFRRFLPNTPCLVNAASETKAKGLMACHVTKAPEDSWKDMIKNIERFGDVARQAGGCGCDLSNIRPEGDPVFGSAHAKACGPIEHMRMISEVMSSITQSGIRGMANLATLSVYHPDIINFIKCKQHDRALRSLLKEDLLNHYDQLKDNYGSDVSILLDRFLSNFNISVLVDDEFMKKVETDEEIELKFNNKVYEKIKAKDLFNLIVENAWKNGDPGLLFYDTINDCPYQYSGQKITAANPCGEETMPDYSSCNLGSIDVSKFYDGNMDWKFLRETISDCMQFLDDVIDINIYPSPEFEKQAKENRPVGLGIMGFADLLLKMETAYGSDDSIIFAKKLAKFLADEAHNKSVQLGEKRGTPKCCKYKELEYRRNVTTTSIAPTGSISLIAGCSSSIEPLFSEKTWRYDNTGQYEIEQPLAHKRFFRCAVSDNKKHRVSWEEHVKIQTAFQLYIDASISKTINCSNDATMEDVKEAFIMAWKKKAKGVTIYRDGSKSIQVLNTQNRSGVLTINQAAPRPRTLQADIFKTSALGYDWHVIVGKYDNAPYEVFALNGKSSLPEKGKIIKRKKRHYSLLDEEDNVIVENLAEQEEEINPQVSLETRRFSLELRHGIHPKYICEQIDKSSEVITSFSKAVNRIMKSKYISPEDMSSDVICPKCAEKGKIVSMYPDSACWRCASCNYSRCG